MNVQVKHKKPRRHTPLRRKRSPTRHMAERGKLSGVLVIIGGAGLQQLLDLRGIRQIRRRTRQDIGYDGEHKNGPVTVVEHRPGLTP